MNTNTNNAIVLNQDSTAEEYAKILRGRYVPDITLTDMDDEGYALTATLTLDNGTALTVEANEGCGGCANGRYHITRAYYRGNKTARIMNARVEYTRNENDIRDGWEKYTIFVMIRAETKPNCPSSPHKATTDPAHTAPDSHSPCAGAQARARKQRRRTSATHHHNKKDKNGRA